MADLATIIGQQIDRDRSFGSVLSNQAGSLQSILNSKANIKQNKEAGLRADRELALQEKEQAALYGSDGNPGLQQRAARVSEGNLAVQQKSLSLEEAAAKTQKDQIIEQKTNRWLLTYNALTSNIESAQNDYDKAVKTGSAQEIEAATGKLADAKLQRGKALLATLKSGFAGYIPKAKWANQDKLKSLIADAQSDLSNSAPDLTELEDILAAHAKVASMISGGSAEGLKVNNIYNETVARESAKVDVTDAARRSGKLAPTKPSNPDLIINTPLDSFMIGASPVNKTRYAAAKANDQRPAETKQAMQTELGGVFQDIIGMNMRRGRNKNRLSELQDFLDANIAEFGSATPEGLVLMNIQDKIADGKAAGIEDGDIAESVQTMLKGLFPAAKTKLKPTNAPNIQ